jgi:hypothetical protein
MQVWIAERIEDHAPGYVIGVFSSPELAEQAIVGPTTRHLMSGRGHNFSRDEDGGVISLSNGPDFSATCVDITPYTLDERV